MDPSSSTFFNNAAAMIDDWIKNNFPVAEFLDSAPALQSTKPLHTPPDWNSQAYFTSPPALESTTPFYTPAAWHGSSCFPSPLH
ncbi:hypothetical protein O181_121751 [Austropuccinia psidii MF-1]|uniref:Uncharacterized protein n=1 Tax=Austropuccinia psidii MF-1 TaxID=1389203 RepID=A0A9Q3Q1R0_9BASI|nr:hypothetical protein [Austropuccinia psidii MF-1]